MCFRYRKGIPYTAIEELEIRVERLEEDMFRAQDDINELQCSMQETIATVGILNYFEGSNLE